MASQVAQVRAPVLGIPSFELGDGKHTLVEVLRHLVFEARSAEISSAC
jgi:hypothetical protein